MGTDAGRERPAAEHPIVFGGLMVQAILAGRKSQTRRAVRFDQLRPEKFSHEGASAFRESEGGWQAKAGKFNVWSRKMLRCPYGVVGGRLWVREAWCQRLNEATSRPIWRPDGETFEVLYAADGQEVLCDDGDGFTKRRKDGTEASPWVSPMRMPRWASRLTLGITGVRVERLQAISVDDAIAEGIDADGGDDNHRNRSTLENFRLAWDAMHAKAGHGWNANPWVWVVEFKPVRTPAWCPRPAGGEANDHA